MKLSILCFVFLLVKIAGPGHTSTSVDSNDCSETNAEAEEVHSGAPLRGGHHVTWVDECSPGESLVSFALAPPPSSPSPPQSPPPPTASSWFSVERVDASTMDQETFRREYADTPVVLTGCDLPKFITTEYLARQYGVKV